MSYLLVSYIFILGTLIGSFLNVVILRYNTGKSIFGRRERSVCFSCSRKLPWYELIPVLSFFFLRARCRGCRSAISWQYPLVEIATGLIFSAIFFVVSDPGYLFGQSAVLFFLYALIWSILIVIAVYDLRHKIIPDTLVFAFISFSLFTTLLFPGLPGSFLSSVLAGLFFFVFFAGLWLVSSGRWLGFGDAKLVVGVGFLLGLVRGLSAMVLAFWIGAIFSLIIIGLSLLVKQKVIPRGRLHRSLRLFTMKSEIPFAPFIILGTLIAFLFEFDLIGISKFF